MITIIPFGHDRWFTSNVREALTLNEDIRLDGVGVSAASGAVSVIPGFGWVNYATPAITNAVNINGNGSV